VTTVDSGADPGADLSAAPDAWHAPASYWFWHRVPTRQEIRDQVSQLASAGFRSFQIQARLAFPLEKYLKLSVRVASTAANRYYAGTRQQGDGLDPSGLGAAPVLRPRLAGGPLHVL
jgi:hypothetical protein